MKRIKALLIKLKIIKVPSKLKDNWIKNWFKRKR